MLFESFPSMASYEFQGALGVGTKSHTGTYFSKGVCGFIYLHVDVVILEETKC